MQGLMGVIFYQSEEHNPAQPTNGRKKEGK